MQDANERTTKVAFEDLASLDLDEFEGLGLESIAGRLRELASRAGTAQLRAVLDLPGGDAVDDAREELVERYIARRLETVKRLRKLKETFRLPDPKRD